MKINTLLIMYSLFFFLITNVSCSQNKQLKDHVLFYSSFDGKLSADVSFGDANIYTAENYKKVDNAKKGLNDPNVVLAKGKGLIGDAIHFKEAKTSAVFYKAYKNVGYNSNKAWSGTISFWLRLDPNKELSSHYCDPICITDSKWSDAGLWVDFTDHNPRKFRFGAMGDIAVWDPNDDSDETDWNKRTVMVDSSPFQSETWTHVAMVFSKVNSNQSTFKLYLNGTYQGVIENINDPFTWEAKKGRIMLGLGYIGLMDELTVFDKPLDSKEIKIVFELVNGIKTLFK